VDIIDAPQNVCRQNDWISGFPTPIHFIHEIIHQRGNAIKLRRGVRAYSDGAWPVLAGICMEARYRVKI
jgi:hypothetical protein